MHDVLMRYRVLYKAGLIGQLWVECDNCYLAPLDAIHGYNAREYITPGNLHLLVVSIELAQTAFVRKGVRSEVAVERVICAA